MKHVLVTGGAGYIGSHACKALDLAGYIPVTFDNLAYGHRSSVRWGPFVHGDILDRAALDAALRAWQPVAVMHFAAFAYVGESVTNPGKYYRNNVAGSLTLLEAMRDAGVGQCVFSSTCATYGVPQAVPIAEDHPQNPINPYGASKLMIERMLHDFDTAHGLRSISLRYFNAAGADPEGETGEAHDPETHLIPLVLDAAAGVRPDVTVFGGDYPTPDGTCIRDYIHVTDLAQAHVLALQALQAGASTTAYNLGNGKGFSVKQVIDAARAVTALNIPVRMGPKRAGDPPELVGNSSRMRTELGWSPQHADLPDIVGTAWRWHQAQRAGNAGQVIS
ncbi:MAG: UDP-glucose 4-epimerase GalE [Burkholderiaceae bacterium]|nr:UDP-glucose 4-epimerase GalE [Burkholderiaceae bacterium]